MRARARASSLAIVALAGQLVIGLLWNPVALAETPSELATSGSNQDWDSAARLKVLTLVNQERATRDLSPLVDNDALDASAQAYATVLTDDACFGHSCGAQPDFTARNTQAGYRPWSWLGENVAAGQPTPEAVVAAWMASPDHRANILRPQFTEVGLGIAHGGVHGTYWAEEFGTRPNIPED